MTLNEYIFANADRISNEGFLREFSSAEVFFSIDAPNDRLRDGPFTSSSAIDLKVPVAKLHIGHVALFYASKHDARLSERFGGLPLIRAAEMVCDIPNIEGMLIQSDGDAWVVARKDALRSVLRDLKALCPCALKDLPAPTLPARYARLPRVQRSLLVIRNWPLSRFLSRLPIRIDSKSVNMSDAKRLAADFLGALPLPTGFSFVILDEYTIERPNCFVFFYESSRFLETERFEDRLAGNAPILVNKKTGTVTPLGTALPVESYIADYEASL